MGIIIECFSLAALPTKENEVITIDVARNAGQAVSSASINSAIFPDMQSWIDRTRLAGLLSDPDRNSIGMYIPNSEFDELIASLNAPGPDGADAVALAIEDAVEEAIWRDEHLWIGVS